jgi:sugar lactone lactonase YvrE
MGTQATLQWDLDGSVTSLHLDGVARTPSTGSLAVTPVRRQTYTLTAADAQGRQATATVEIAAQGMDLLAGSAASPGCLDGKGANARFAYPGPACTDAQGNLYVGDYMYNVIRKVALDGEVTTYAGVPAYTGGYVDGPASQARFSTITGLAMAPDGTLFVVDHGNGRVRKVVGGQVSTFVTLGGGGSGLFSEQAALDAAGNLYVPLYLEGRVVRVTPAGTITDATTGMTYPGQASISPTGELFVLESFQGLVYRVGADRTRTLVTFTYAPGDPGGTGSLWGTIRSMVWDGAGKMYLQSTTRVYQVDAVNQVSTLLQVDGSQLAQGALSPIAWSSAGFLWAARTNFGAVVGKLAPGMPFAEVAGASFSPGYMDGPGAQAQFNEPTAIVLDPQGNILVADRGNGLLRKVAPDGTVSTVPVTGGSAPSAAMWMDPKGDLLFVDATGSNVLKLSGGATSTVGSRAANPLYLNRVAGIAGDGAGTVYLTDTATNSNRPRVEAMNAAGSVSSLAGGGFSGYADGPGAQATFSDPSGIAFSKGAVFVAETDNCDVRKIALDGTVSTLAGLAGAGPAHADGTGVAARFAGATALAADADGNLFVADTDNHCIRKITPLGVVTTVVGSPSLIGIRLGRNGTLLRPLGLLVTPRGDLVVLDHAGVFQVTMP